jgi:pyruvate kinase
MSIAIDSKETPENGRAGSHLDVSRAKRLAEQLGALRDGMLHVEAAWGAKIAGVHPEQRPSARNLLHYVSLRNQDLRPLQEELGTCGLSSLGHCEAHVLSNVNAVLDILGRLAGIEAGCSPCEAPVDLVSGRSRIQQNTQQLFGPRPPLRGAHIMVTMPSTAADDYQLVRDLVSAGMNCMRINCAHDEQTAWAAMIANLRRAEQELNRSCRILMDLGGPKLRTGPVAAGPQVIKSRPSRDEFGHVIAPARLWLSAPPEVNDPPRPVRQCVPVDPVFLGALEPGTEITFLDAGGRQRGMKVVERVGRGVWAELKQTSYFTPGIILDATTISGQTVSGSIGEFPAEEQKLVLYRGDHLIVTDDQQPGQPARHDRNGRVIQPACISCTLPGVLQDLRVGDRMLLDDGKIGGVVRETQRHFVVVEINQARPGGERLGGDKGINLPDSQLRLDALTEKDIADLTFVAQHADMVGYSFVRRPEDVERLQHELEGLGRAEIPIVLKIENRQAFEHLPSLLLAAMRSPVAGVMIARGDLAVECGYERLAEIQEELLWMCEAAHMPVVWATQVLEGLAKDGVPSRAEITDAAMSVRAECVMLNKGPFIGEAVRVLDNIILRMQDHQVKKRPLLRRLHLADNLGPTVG